MITLHHHRCELRSKTNTNTNKNKNKFKKLLKAQKYETKKRTLLHHHASYDRKKIVRY
jgi:hypothetical protein